MEIFYFLFHYFYFYAHIKESWATWVKHWLLQLICLLTNHRKRSQNCNHQTQQYNSWDAECMWTGCFHRGKKTTLRSLSGAVVGASCCLVHRSRTNTDRHEVSPWCWEQHLCVVMSLPESSTSFVSGGHLRVKSCNHILAMARDDHQWLFRGFRNDDSEGQGVTIHSQPFSLWRTMEHLFWPSVFTLSLGCDRAGVSGQHMASSDWKQIGMVLNTPALSLLKN